MGYGLPIPEKLTGAHLKDARLFADRYELTVALATRRFDRIAEIGVAYGDMSVHLYAAYHPLEFHAFDLFDLHNHEIVLGVPSATRFLGQTHGDFFAGRFPKAQIFAGDSSTCMNRQPEKYYDLIYIDGAHDYEGVRKDTDACLRTIKDDGVLVFNDYTPYDPIASMPYGVMHVVNYLCINKGWRILGLALQPLMFCDVALARG
jgi:hypothetical protein